MIAYIPCFRPIRSAGCKARDWSCGDGVFARYTFSLVVVGITTIYLLLIQTVLEFPSISLSIFVPFPWGIPVAFPSLFSVTSGSKSSFATTYRTAANSQLPRSSQTINQVNILPTLSANPPTQAPNPIPPFAANIPVREALSYLQTHQPAHATNGISPSPTIPLSKTLPCCSTFFLTSE